MKCAKNNLLNVNFALTKFYLICFKIITINVQIKRSFALNVANPFLKLKSKITSNLVFARRFRTGIKKKMN